MSVIGILVVICIIYSSVYVNKEAHHDCRGESCPVCFHLHAMQDLLKQIKAVAISVFCCPMLLVGFKYIFLGINIIFKRQTPVTLRVRLLN